MNRVNYRYLRTPEGFLTTCVGSGRQRGKGITGQLYCNSTTGYLEVHNGVRWENVEPYEKISLSQEQFDKLTTKKS